MSGAVRKAWRWVRPGVGAAVVAILVWQLGTGPFVDGIRRIGPWSLLVATAITAGTTVCSAWRWQTVARGLGVGLPLGTAVASYYRSQFLNSALPGGVVGDVHRGVRHGLDAGDLGRGLRAVAWERTTGQAVFVVFAVGGLLVLDSPVRPAVPWAVGAMVAAALCVAAALRKPDPDGSSRRARALRAARCDIRSGLLDRRAWPVVTGTSVVVAAGHSGIFLVAAQTTGSTASPAELWPLAMLAMLAMLLPLSIGGWGPREGMAAWAFAAAGLGAAQGVATATAYGVLGLVATMPGALVLAVDRIGGARNGRPRATGTDARGAAGVPAPRPSPARRMSLLVPRPRRSPSGRRSRPGTPTG